MGVEPTAARSARPATGFEDRGIHRDTTTPLIDHHYNQCSPDWQPDKNPDGFNLTVTIPLDRIIAA